ncbi:MAG: FtsQ-type POTRA domain-containing protein [Candidatus Limnocylindrales bacterium]
MRSVQVLSAVLMAACLVAGVAVSLAPSFSARTLEIHGATFTGSAVISSILGMDGAPNVFRLGTDQAAAQLVRLPAVKSASIQVRLPSTVVVDIVEREPKLVWVVGSSRYVVDQDGLIFGLVDSAGNPIASNAGPVVTPTATASSSAASSEATSAAPSRTASPSPKPKPTPSPTPKVTPTPAKPPAKATPTKPGTKSSPSPSPAASPTPTFDASQMPSLAPAPTTDPAATSGPGALGLPVVFDRRASDAGLGLGGVVDPINLDAGYRLAGLTPADIGSSTPALAVVVDDDHGFTLSSVPSGWVAEFGFYAPTVRKVTVLPGQVRDLRSMLAYYGEAHVAWVRLVADVSADHVNTYIPR